MKSYGVTIHVETTEHRVCSYGTVYTHCKMALPFEPVDAVPKIDLLIETREEGTKFDILSCTSYPSLRSKRFQSSYSARGFCSRSSFLDELARNRLLGRL